MEVSSRKCFVSDCEGPLTINDNAYELSENFIPEGGELFSKLSKYDDVKSEILDLENYESGSTLKFILPFLKAYGCEDEDVENFSKKTLRFLPGARIVLEKIKKIFPSYIVSTSYRHYIKSLCDEVDFPFENTYCTEMSLDNLELSSEEKEELKEISREMIDLPEIKISENFDSMEDLPEDSREAVKKIDFLMNDRISNFQSSKFIENVNPVGGQEKAKAIEEISRNQDIPISNFIYFGDSITDVEAFRLVKERGGVAVSFNGNSFAVKNSDIILGSENAEIIFLISSYFKERDREELLNIVKDLEENIQDIEFLSEKGGDFYRENPPYIELSETDRFQKAVNKSMKIREKVRGKNIGELG